MTKFIQWLSDHRWYNILLLLAYFLLVVLPHEQVGLFATWLFSSFSREQYNLIILALSIGLVVSVVFLLIKKIALHPERSRIIFFTFSSLLLIAYSFQVLFVVNVEAIHFIQYAIFAILCFPLVRHYTRTLIWSTLAGGLDEGYQFFYLAPERTPHFDWNDIIINVVGAALGLIVLKIYQIPEEKSGFSIWHSPLFYTLLSLCIAFFVLHGTGILSIVQDPAAPTPLTLVKELPTSYWTILPKPYVKYHIVLPLEGLLSTLGLIFFYSRLNR